MPQRVDFSNFNDGIDWEHALPPHVTAQREAARPPPIPQQSRTLVFDWPLPENHPALHQPPPRQSRRPPQTNPSDFRAPLQRSSQMVAPSSSSEQPVSRREMLARRDREAVDLWNGVVQPSPLPARGGRVNRGRGGPVLPANMPIRESPSPLPITPPSVRSASRSPPPRQLPPMPQAQSTDPVSLPRATNPGQQARRTGDGWELQDFSYEALLELGSLAVATGLGKDQLSKMKAHTFNEPEPVDCSICLEDVNVGSACMKLVCQHVFHPNCILQWLARTNRCPTCRCEIRRKD